MWRETDTVAVTPRGVINAIRREFGEDYAVDFDRLVLLIEEAADPDVAAKNHIVRVLRMWIDTGFKPADLIAATLELRDTLGDLGAPPRQKRNPYADELVPSTWQTPSRWRLDARAKLDALTQRFRLHIGDLDFRSRDHRFDTEDFPAAVVPKPSVLAVRKGIKDPYGSGYPDLLNAVLSEFPRWPKTSGPGGVAATILEKHLRLYEQLELHPMTRTWLEKLERESRSDFIAFPCQIGERWRGSSMARFTWHAEHEDFQVGLFWREVPLPAYVVLIELLLQPQRLASPSVLGIDCPGDVVHERFGFRSNGLCLAYGHETLHLLARPRDRPDAMFASATGLMR